MLALRWGQDSKARNEKGGLWGQLLSTKTARKKEDSGSDIAFFMYWWSSSS
jgi:hypothetical protein